MSEPEILLERLPRFPVPASRTGDTGPLRITGLVQEPLTLSVEALRTLLAVELTADTARAIALGRLTRATARRTAEQ